ncbi:hypothetical protein QW060_23140 [Myroides ceti]|uniref:Uncharacterized protein n=1 Tax=Paenimyroides ceti TaxID=395087 RepID=A0ABT8CZ26_9FLAO|nr:hypothetical protein [Paenimyroides ceti]MDN3709833.1 hypothetical protein [Paenimyroides ceti]
MKRYCCWFSKIEILQVKIRISKVIGFKLFFPYNPNIKREKL